MIRTSPGSASDPSSRRAKPSTAFESFALAWHDLVIDDDDYDDVHDGAAHSGGEPFYAPRSALHVLRLGLRCALPARTVDGETPGGFLIDDGERARRGGRLRVAEHADA